ncbi:MAG: metallopeptidase family protein [Gemmatimonadota bacterium]|nr:metallopeptidase family protein [Gemmatimonadota bacterium]
MKLPAFRRRASQMWDEIPPESREGVEALTVEERELSHPDFEEVYTLGECVTEVWPSGFGGEGDTRSELVLYHGSFRALAELDPTFDWEEELWETILHELLHHREAAAGESGLDDFDWAEEQNRLRLWGRPFDPDFYRAVPADADGVVRLDSELFVESTIPPGAVEAPFNWRGHAYTIRVPAEAERAFVEVANLANGRLCVVARRRRPWWKFWDRADGVLLADERRSALPVPAGS